MKVDGGIGNDLSTVAAEAKEREDAGYAGIWTAETSHDPFFPLLLAAEHTKTIELGTSIAVAFARSPMTLANVANDLQAYSKGRFILGLGSQIKPHITKRFSMPWSHPAPTCEMVLAIRHLDCWNSDKARLPRRLLHAHVDDAVLQRAPTRTAPKISWPVGRTETEVAGETCDGFLCHGFTTERHLRGYDPALEAVKPKWARRWRASDRRSELRRDRHERRGDGQGHRRGANDRAYGSTPIRRARPPRRGGLQEDLNKLSKQGQWVEMGNLIDDEMLNTFAVVGAPEDIAPELHRRYGDVIGRISFYAPYRSDPERWKGVLSALSAA
jgi:probable F420-dependent oxidoreductase